MNIENFEKDKILAPYTTYKIGGIADYFFIAKNKEDLVQVILFSRKNKIPYFVLGTGANILFSDKGFKGLVIKNESNQIKFENTKVITESGTTIEDLINESVKKELSGFEHFAGIPSTVGGAIWQNLHFLSPDRLRTVFIEEIFDSAEILDSHGNIKRVNKEFFGFGYDYSLLHDEEIIVLEAVFNLTQSKKEKIENQIKENIKWRNEKQPQLDKHPSCGSVFKKIEGIGAGRLITEVEMKGYKEGGIQVSEKHPNFLVNTGNAKALDVLNVIKKIQKEVKEKTGYQLETEISFIGEF